MKKKGPYSIAGLSDKLKEACGIAAKSDRLNKNPECLWVVPKQSPTSPCAATLLDRVLVSLEVHGKATPALLLCIAHANRNCRNLHI